MLLLAIAIGRRLCKKPAMSIDSISSDPKDLKCNIDKTKGE